METIDDVLREMDSIKNNYECYVVEWWDDFCDKWVVYDEFLDCADAEKGVSRFLEYDKMDGLKFKYRIIKKTIYWEIVYETEND